MIGNLEGKTALITGGTMGIGLATAVALSRRGADCAITFKWGTADLDQVRTAFANAGAQQPLIVQADVANNEDLTLLLDQLRERWSQVDILVSNVAVALVIQSLADYSLRSLNKSIEYTAWPLFEYTRRIQQQFGKYPRYVIGMSSPGPDSYSYGYDFVATSKAVLETMCRYMSHHLFDEDVRINIIRSQAVRTQNWRATFKGFEEFAKKFMQEEHFISPEEVANVVVALCSGYLDGMRGQVLTVDRGISQFDNLIGLFSERERLGL
ncbi:MAG TPA: SDR family oxidoreductase [Terriglobia bacterium]|nr:SDR family oxidoreductase [Terriglobia bacterium]